MGEDDELNLQRRRWLFVLDTLVRELRYRDANRMEDSTVPVALDPEVVTALRRSEARWRLGQASASELADRALALLQRDEPPSPALAELATSIGTGDPRDVRDLIEIVLLELGLPPLSREGATRIVISDIATQIIAGAVEPEAGAQEIWRMSAPLPINQRPNELIALSSDWERINPEEQNEVRAEIIRAARDLLA